MDNLAHALTGGLLAATTHPHWLQKHPARTLLAALVVVNLPDIDVLLGLKSYDYYMFEHRGTTHSFLGLPLMVGLGALVTRGFFPPRMGKDFSSWWTFAGFALIQLLIGHFFLDYLTTYGTMFFHPLSYKRFSLPLMFIIDPYFWLIGLTGVIFLLVRRGQNVGLTRVKGVLALSVMAGYWSYGLWQKAIARELVAKVSGVTEREDIKTFPLPLAPSFWNVLQLKDQRTPVAQYFVDLGALPEARVEPLPFPEVFTLDACGPLKEGLAYQRYKSWGEWIRCREEEPRGCQCTSLKYSLPGAEIYPFGDYTILTAEEGEFVRRDPNQMKESWPRYRSYYNRVFGHWFLQQGKEDL